MIIIGVDFHPEFQQMASVDTDTGEFQEKRLTHREEAEKFYHALIGKEVRVGMEASGHARWFERLLSELRFEFNIGDAAEIRTKRVRKQKTDRQDAELILRCCLKIVFRAGRNSKPALLRSRYDQIDGFPMFLVVIIKAPTLTKLFCCIKHVTGHLALLEKIRNE